MGPTLLLDKSCYQALSPLELEFLYRYFLLVIPPVFLAEILGDISLPEDPNRISRSQVEILAGKFQTLGSGTNVHHRDLIARSLLGDQVVMDGRPHVLSEPRNLPDGRQGAYIPVSREEAAILRWRDGEFSDEERELSEQWRAFTTGQDLIKLQGEWREVARILPKAASLEELIAHIDRLLMDADRQKTVLEQILYEFSVPQSAGSAAFHRWEQGQHRTIREFAPYAFYCFRLASTFHFGLARDFVSTRSTNLVDLEYCYYLPFAMVFASGDKFHRTLAPKFLGSDQFFVPRKELKDDLKALAESWRQLDRQGQAQWIAEFGNRPPVREDSVIHQIWRKLMSPGGWETQRSEADDVDFVQFDRLLTASDPCPCSSGQRFRDCCWDKVKRAARS